MAEKVDPVVEIVEEEEEEWPEAGAQNVAEAEQYQDKINHISRCLHRIRDTSKQSKLYSVKCFIPK